MDISTFKRVTDVQATWKAHGWLPPSEDPDIRAKWLFFRTLDTSGENSDLNNQTELMRIER